MQCTTPLSLTFVFKQKGRQTTLLLRARDSDFHAVPLGKESMRESLMGGAHIEIALVNQVSDDGILMARFVGSTWGLEPGVLRERGSVSVVKLKQSQVDSLSF